MMKNVEMRYICSETATLNVLEFLKKLVNVDPVPVGFFAIWAEMEFIISLKNKGRDNIFYFLVFCFLQKRIAPRASGEHDILIFMNIDKFFEFFELFLKDR